MIRTFGDKETEKIFNENSSRKFPHEIQVRALAKLRLIHAATRLDDLKIPPSNRLHGLKGDLKGFHGIRINDQWRVVFQWIGRDAEKVRICDYH